MPIIKNSDHYISLIHKRAEDHYGITIPKRIIKTILDEYQNSVYKAVMKALCIETYHLGKIEPVTPLLRNRKIMYYNLTLPSSKEVRRLKKISRSYTKEKRLNANKGLLQPPQ